MLVSKRTFDDMTSVASVCITGSDAMNGLIDGDDVERDTDRIRDKWPGVTARDLRVAGIAITFCLAALDGTMPKLTMPGYCSSLFKTEAATSARWTRWTSDGRVLRRIPPWQGRPFGAGWIRAGRDKRAAVRMAARHRQVGLPTRQGEHLRRLRTWQDGNATRMGATVRRLDASVKRGRPGRGPARSGGADRRGGAQVRHRRDAGPRDASEPIRHLRHELRDAPTLRPRGLRRRCPGRVEHPQVPQLQDEEGAYRWPP